MPTDNGAAIVSPRFGPAPLPGTTASRPHHTHDEQDYNPDAFETRTLDVEAPKNPDGSPIIADPDLHKVSPLDLAKAAEIVRARRSIWEGKDADEAPFDPTERQHTVRDSTRRYAFTGTRLAYVSSESPRKTRWTDIEIYRTSGGMFIVHRVGVTTLAHLENCEQLKRYHKRYTPGINGIASDEFPPENREPCPDCKPNLEFMLRNEPAALKFERDRHQVNICETAEGVIQALHTIKDGKRTLGTLAMSALQMSADRDVLIASAFYAQTA